MYRIRLYIVPEHEEFPESESEENYKDPSEGKTALWWREPSPPAPPLPDHPPDLVTVTHRSKAKVKVTFSEPVTQQQPMIVPMVTSPVPPPSPPAVLPPAPPTSPPPPPPPKVSTPPTATVTLRDRRRNKNKEFDLEQKIDLEIKMREGSTKLLAACRHQTQTLEAAKNLLTSNERMSAYMAELQRRKKEPPARPLGTQPCLARVSLSDLRMPLIWRDTDHFKNKGDYRRFAVFCLARIGTEIYDTTLLCPVDRSLTDLTFPDVLFFNNISSDFEFKLEVYSHILQDDLSIASTPRKIKKTIHSSISRTVGKKLAASLKDELNTGKIGPHFELMATARLSLDEVHDSIHTHDLQVENLENRSHQLPLFGHFCCRLAAQPDCISQEVYSGDISLMEGEDKGCQWTSVWAQLQAFRLDMWTKREHWEQGQDPLRSIVVDRDTLIQPKKSKEITISNLQEGKEDPSVIRVKTTEEQQKWICCLVQHTKDHLRWKHAAVNVMEIQSPGTTRHSFTRQLRQGSLYDETPLIESVNPDYHRPTVQEIFGMTPSTSLSSCASSSSSPTFRERSYSSGGSNKGRVSATGTVRAHWPFTRNNPE